MKRLGAVLASVWHYEPILLTALPTVLATAGFTTAEAHTTTQAVSGALAAVAQLVLAFAARHKVKPTGKAQS